MAAPKSIKLLRKVSGGDTEEIYPKTKWDQVFDHPSSFTPTYHTHVINDVTGLSAALDSKVAKNATITPGTKIKISYDAKGLVTGGADLLVSDLPSGSTPNTFLKTNAPGNVSYQSITVTDISGLQSTLTSIQSTLATKIGTNKIAPAGLQTVDFDSGFYDDDLLLIGDLKTYFSREGHTHAYSDITGKPTKLSQFTNDTNFVTSSGVTEVKGTAPISVSGGTTATATISLADDGVTTTKIADNAVTTAKIDRLAVTSAKLGPSSVTSSKIADGAVANEKLATMSPLTIKGNNSTDGSIAPIDLTMTQVKGMLALNSTDISNAFSTTSPNNFFATPYNTAGKPSLRPIVVGDLPTGTTSSTVSLGNHTHSQYALDTAVVKLTTNQTIAGVKTFSSVPLIPDLTDFTTNSKQGVNVSSLLNWLSDYAFADNVVDLESGQDIRGVKNFESTLLYKGNEVATEKWAKDNLTYDLYLEGNTTGNAGTWTATDSRITEYKHGMSFQFKIGIAGAGTTTLNINNLGPKTIYRGASSLLTTQYVKDYVVPLVYDATLNDGCFLVQGYDDTTEIYTIRGDGYELVGADAITRYKMVAEGADGKLYPLSIGDTSAATKTASTRNFKIGGRIFWYVTTTTIAANATTRNYMARYGLSSYVQYTLNAAAGFTAGMPIYLVGIVQSDGSYKLDNSSLTSFYTQTLPTTEDNKIYIQLGIMSTATTKIRIDDHHPIFEYKDEKIRLYVPKHRQPASDIDVDTGVFQAETIPDALDELYQYKVSTITGTAPISVTPGTNPTISVASGYTIPTNAQITNFTSAYTDTNNATNANTASRIVKRDSSGNFSAGIISATLSGTASSAGYSSNVTTSINGKNITDIFESNGTTAKIASTLATGRTFTITDNDATNSQASATTFNGSENFTLKLPATIKAALSGNATTATTLANARTIGISGGATGTATSFNGGSNISIPITSVSEAYLTWGGKNHFGTYGPIDAAMVGELGANRLAFMNPTAITIEYSTDAGSTWLDYASTDSAKVNLFNGNGAGHVIGKNTVAGTNITKYQLRVSINTAFTSLYTVLNKFVLLVSTNGSSGSWVTIDGRTRANVVSNTNTWTTFENKVGLSGWSGYNVINTSGITTWGNSDGQYQQFRFTFGNTGYNPAYTGLSVMSILGFGGVGWSTPSNLAKKGVIYTYDYLQNTTFPGNVNIASGKSFTINGTALNASHIGAKPNFSENTAFNKNFTASGGNNGTAVTVARGDHNHDNAYLKLTGGTLTGILALNSSNIEMNGGDIHMDGGIIYGAGGLQTSTINGKSVTDIFESNGTTVKNATSATSATTATKLGSTTVGSATKPIYLSNGTATQITGSISGSNTGDQTIKLEGDVTGTGTTTFTTTLATVNSSPGTKTAATIVVDAKGRVTSATSNTIPTKTSDLTNDSNFVTSSGVTEVKGTSPVVVSNGATATATVSLAGGYGDTQSPFTKADRGVKLFLATPNTGTGAPSFRAIVAADLPTHTHSGADITSGLLLPAYGGTGVNNGTRTLTVNTNSGTIAFSSASKTLTVANTASVSGTNTGDQTVGASNLTIASGTGISLNSSSGLNDFSANATSDKTITITNTAPNANHTGDVTGSGELTIGANKVTNAKLAKMAANTIKGNNNVSSADPIDLSIEQVKNMLGGLTSSKLGLARLTSDTLLSQTPQSLSTTLNRTYAIQQNANNQLVVNVPWNSSSAWVGIDSLNSLSFEDEEGYAYMRAEYSINVSTGTGMYLDGGRVLTSNEANSGDMVRKLSAKPIVTLTRTNIPLTAASYINKMLRINGTANTLLTIPVGLSATIWPFFEEIDIFRNISYDVTFSPASGVTLNSEGNKRKINAQYQAVTIKRVALNEYILVGALKT